MKKIFIIPVLIVVVLFTACTPKQTEQVSTADTLKKIIAADTLIKRVNFQKEVDGKKVDLYTLTNSKGMIVKITNFGGIIVSVIVPDKNGKLEDVTLGFETIDEYINDKSYQGAIIGRYANRIANATFKLDKKEFKLAQNDGTNSLHGGIKGFHKVVWDAVQDSTGLTLQYISPDMEEGYPGELKVIVRYSLNDDNELKIAYEATTNKKTVLNLTNHAFYNLHGEGVGDILSHLIQINADAITPVNGKLIPTGEIKKVEGSPFDLRQLTPVNKMINNDDEQLKAGKGYDHNWVLNKTADSLALAATLVDTISGRKLEIFTTEPAIQFYAGNFYDGSVKGKKGILHIYRIALALEPQHYPDSPNQPKFPSVVLEPGKVYKQVSVYKFGIQ